MKESKLVSMIDKFFIESINQKLAAHSLPWLLPIKRFQRVCYVQESENSTLLAKFRYDMVDNGRKYPRCGRISVHNLCPLCPCSISNSVSHIAMYCPMVESTRKEKTEITFFRNVCLRKGFTEEYTFSLYINGFDWNENIVDSNDYLKRGAELSLVLENWLSKWWLSCGSIANLSSFLIVLSTLFQVGFLGILMTAKCVHTAISILTEGDTWLQIFRYKNNLFLWLLTIFISLKPDTDILLVCPLCKFILVRRRLPIM